MNVIIIKMYNFGFDLPYAGVLIVASIIIGAWFMSQLVQKKMRLPSHALYFWAIVAVCVLVHLTIILSHHAQQFDGPAQARLFFIHTVLISLIPVMFTIRFPDRLSPKALAAGAVIVFCLYHPIAVQSSFMNHFHPMHTNAICRDFLNHTRAHNPLIVTRFAVQYISMGYSSVDFENLVKYKDEIAFDYKTHLYDKIFVFMEVGLKTRKPLPLQGIVTDENMKLEILQRIRTAHDRYLTISTLEFK